MKRSYIGSCDPPSPPAWAALSGDFGCAAGIAQLMADQLLDCCSLQPYILKWIGMFLLVDFVSWSAWKVASEAAEQYEQWGRLFVRWDHRRQGLTGKDGDQSCHLILFCFRIFKGHHLSTRFPWRISECWLPSSLIVDKFFLNKYFLI